MFRECYEITTLGNGLRIVSETMPSVNGVAVGLYVGVGARYERGDEAGLTHFLEHMLFKGTLKRSAREIAVEIESRGGTINAYTDKEYTCYYARGLGDDLELIVDVLADMLRNARLAPEDVETEKGVVLEEIKRVRDDPEDAVHELLDRTAWKGHPLGRSTLGTPQTVSRFTSEQLRTFISTHYVPQRIVLAAAGKLKHGDLVKHAAERFGDMSGAAPKHKDRSPTIHPAQVHVRRRCEQAVFCVGMAGYSYGDPRRYALIILDAVLGGTMGSRLFQEVREKRGLVYDISSSTVGFRDSGLFSISGGTSPDHLPTVLRLVHDELDKVKHEGLTTSELSQSKRRLRGLLLLSQDNVATRMGGLGRSLLLLDRVIPFDEVLQELEAVTNESVMTVAREVFNPEREVVVSLGPTPRNGR